MFYALSLCSNFFEIRDGPNSDSQILDLQGEPIIATNSTTVVMLSRTNQVFVSYIMAKAKYEPGFPLKIKFTNYSEYLDFVLTAGLAVCLFLDI